MDLKEENLLRRDPATHWYYVSKVRAVVALLGNWRVPELLDVGAGSGVIARQLIAAEVASSAVCVDPGYSSEWEEHHRGASICYKRSVNDVPQRFVVLMDVLEHVDDDLGLLSHYTRQMASGSRVLITVPAFRWLWSDHDEFLEHRRRYTIREVEKLVEKAGLKIIQARYFFGLLFPLIAALRVYKRTQRPGNSMVSRSDMRDYPDWVNYILIRLHDVERTLMLPINRLFGLSVICLAEKTSNDALHPIS